tara:strand:- start:16800 stop:17486 length:687 start_codon:yes stop_codon:yes gene_type:complete
MFSNARGMAICIGVTGVASILLWFYFKNRIESVETKLDNMFNMIQNFAQPPEMGTVASNEVTDYYQQGGETTEDPFENKELQYENQNSSPQLPTEMFEKEIEEVVNNNSKLIEVSEDSGEDSSEEESGEESGEESEEEIGKKEQMELQTAKEDKDTDSLDDVESEEEESDDDQEEESDDDVKKVELKEEVKEYSSMKVSELKKLAQTKGLTGYTKLNKAGLVNLLENN